MNNDGNNSKKVKPSILKRLNLGSVGAILNLLSYFFGGILSIFGYSMILLKVKKLSEKYGDKSIFKTYLYAYVYTLFIFIVSLIGGLIIGNNINNYDEFYTNYTLFKNLMIIIFIIYISAIIVSYLIKQAYTKLSQYDNKLKIFKKIGNLYFYGALSSIFIIGIFIVIYAQILEMKAYSELDL